jgi:hypothetical protein
MNATQMQSDSINELATALSLAQSKFETAPKDAKAHYGKYADLTSVWGAARGPLTDNGLSVIQTLEIVPDICPQSLTFCYHRHRSRRSRSQRRRWGLMFG